MVFISRILRFFIFLSIGSCFEYFIRYEIEDVPCIIVTNDSSWIRCLINQSNPLGFHHTKRTKNFNIEFIFSSIENLTLPSNFFRNDGILSNYESIRFDMTHDNDFKQLIIQTNTFVNLDFRRIDFIILKCGLPALNIERNSFSFNLQNRIFIAYENRTQIILLQEFFSQLCWINDKSFFLNDYMIISTKMKSQKKQQLSLFINGLIFSTITSLTITLMCLLRRLE